jgi:hypothetical protein
MMEHKAFVFDYESFEPELRPTLERALASRDVSDLVSFVNEHLDFLTDPYEGEALDENWQRLVSPKDVHQYGDFALTKYYDPRADIGLGVDWERVEEVLPAGLQRSPILGHTIGPEGALFDPGKMGAYFQSAQEVHESRKLLEGIEGCRIPAVLRAVEMLRCAVEAGRGLYVTF